MADKTTTRPIETHVLVCGGKKCCPTVRFNDDGGMTIVDDDGDDISLNAMQVAKLVKLATDRGL